MAKYYGIKEQKEAQDYIRQRLENEYAMDNAVDDVMASFVKMYLDLLYSGASQEELDALIDDLALQLLDDCETLAVDEHEKNRQDIIAFITKEWNGMTLDERIRERCKTFADEIFLLFVVGRLLGKAESAIRSSIIQNWNKPYQNPLIDEAKEFAAKGKITVPVSLEQPHFGQGVPISSHKAIGDITRYAVVQGWGWHDYTEHKEDAVGYVVQRGSSFPCDVCDSHVGYHEIDDEDNLPMFHNHCRCYVIWVYNREAL